MSESKDRFVLTALIAMILTYLVITISSIIFDEKVFEVVSIVAIALQSLVTVIAFYREST